MLLVAAALSLLIGLSLGLLGGGGSILTVPILIYALGMAEKPAIATSLLVVSVTSAVAAIQHHRNGNVCWKNAIAFSPAAMLGAYGGGRVAQFIPAWILLLLFAAIMIATAAAMWFGRAETAEQAANPCGVLGSGGKLPYGRIAAEGLVVGTVTGLVGAGGGFLVVPALVMMGGLIMKAAIGTSLVVIALKSATGFAGYISHVTIDYRLAAVVTAAAVAGSLIGAPLGKRISAQSLRKGFAAFVFAMALFIIYKEVPRP